MGNIDWYVIVVVNFWLNDLSYLQNWNELYRHKKFHFHFNRVLKTNFLIILFDLAFKRVGSLKLYEVRNSASLCQQWINSSIVNFASACVQQIQLHWPTTFLSAKCHPQKFNRNCSSIARLTHSLIQFNKLYL